MGTPLDNLETAKALFLLCLATEGGSVQAGTPRRTVLWRWFTPFEFVEYAGYRFVCDVE